MKKRARTSMHCRRVAYLCLLTHILAQQVSVVGEPQPHPLAHTRIQGGQAPRQQHTQQEQRQVQDVPYVLPDLLEHLIRPVVVRIGEVPGERNARQVLPAQQRGSIKAWSEEPRAQEQKRGRGRATETSSLHTTHHTMGMRHGTGTHVSSSARPASKSPRRRMPCAMRAASASQYLSRSLSGDRPGYGTAESASFLECSTGRETAKDERAEGSVRCRLRTRPILCSSILLHARAEWKQRPGAPGSLSGVEKHANSEKGTRTIARKERGRG